jgi:hypothetical protein
MMRTFAVVAIAAAVPLLAITPSVAQQYGSPQHGYYRYGYSQSAPGWYNPGDGRRYTTVTVTNRGQNGYRDDVVQQQVVCGSQYYDGYRTRIAPQC